jgi:hypothetical protein
VFQPARPWGFRRIEAGLFALEEGAVLTLTSASCHQYSTEWITPNQSRSAFLRLF